MAAVTIAPRRFENPPFVLTIDLEEWFCVCGDDHFGDVRRWDSFEARVEPVTKEILGWLEAGGHRATFFVLGWVAKKYPRLVSDISSRNHEIAFHGMEHRRVGEMTSQEFRAELADGKKLLEDLSGKALRGYRAAEWSIRSPADPALQILAEEGFSYDASITPVRVIGGAGNPPHPFDLRFENGKTLTEFPPLSGRAWFNTVLFGSGWAFRRLRWNRILRVANEYCRAGAPPVFTFHPWELDAEHPPMTGLPALHRLPRFAHSRKMPEKFFKVLAGKQMVPLGDLR